MAGSGAGRVVQPDAQGTEVRTIGGLGFPNSVECTLGGGFLTTNWTGGEVRRYAADASLRWKRQGGGTLPSAQERYDGHPTVCDTADGCCIALRAVD